MYKVVCTCVQDEDMDDIKIAVSKFPMEYAGDELYAVFMEKSFASWDEQIMNIMMGGVNLGGSIGLQNTDEETPPN